jgi:outer membrane lipase/esterase
MVFKQLIAAAALAAGIAAPGIAADAKPKFDNVVVFGDSLSDVGNIFLFTHGAEPAAPYDDGRFSNGQLWVEHVAGIYGVTLSPSGAGPTDFGNDWAYGGAETTIDVPVEAGVSIPSLKTQSIAYLASAGGTADPKTLYVIWGGGNDVFHSIAGDNGTAAPAALPAKFATRTVGVISRLKNAGARHFLVLGVPDVGLTPDAIGAGAGAAATQLSGALNAALAASLADATLNAGVAIYFINVTKVMDGIVNGPTHFGFTDVTDPCYPGTGTAFCPDPDHSFFWDAIHPTAFGHAMIAVEAAQALPH